MGLNQYTTAILRFSVIFFKIVIGNVVKFKVPLIFQEIKSKWNISYTFLPILQIMSGV